MEKGLIAHDIWLEFARNPLEIFHSPVWTQHFAEEELKKITADAYEAFYINTGHMMKQLIWVNSFKQFKTMLRDAIGMWKK